MIQLSAAQILIKMVRDSDRPVVTDFDLFLLARELFRDRKYGPYELSHKNGALTAMRARALISSATSEFYSHLKSEADVPLPRDKDFTSLLFEVHDADAEAVMMAADPFCYLSHASALAWHGLSKESAELHVTTPVRSLWRGYANTSISSALGKPLFELDEDDFPLSIVYPKPKPEVRGRITYRHETERPCEQIDWAAPLRVTPIGVTFRDALEAPAWCGGIEQVIAIWKNKAREHLDEIVEAVSASRDKITRVRAGYLIEEMLQISDPRLDAWAKDAQRGSSRKLDSAAPYASRFSARWMLSINMDDPELPSVTL